ncbi:MAG: F0F1 ATP synthase subunit gamma [Clostridiales bacterium]|nr:MAG: F0F1 ATP synthase subunit gamma [Clostridiales bacterium]
MLDESKPACHIVIAGDRGLAGGYNSNLFKSVDLKRRGCCFSHRQKGD